MVGRTHSVEHSMWSGREKGWKCSEEIRHPLYNHEHGKMLGTREAKLQAGLKRGHSIESCQPSGCRRCWIVAGSPLVFLDVQVTTASDCFEMKRDKLRCKRTPSKHVRGMAMRCYICKRFVSPEPVEKGEGCKHGISTVRGGSDAIHDPTCRNVDWSGYSCPILGDL